MGKPTFVLISVAVRGAEAFATASRIRRVRRFVGMRLGEVIGVL